MGAAWPRAIAPSGNRAAETPKLWIVMSFIVLTILRPSFLNTHAQVRVS